MNSFTRRELLGGIGAAAALGTMYGKPAKAEALKLGVASYSLRKLSRAEAIKALEQLGVRYVKIKEYHAKIAAPESEWRQARKDFENAGLTILGVGNITMVKKDEGEIRRNFEYAKTLGAPAIIMAPSHETVPMIETFVKQYNIKAAIHNHGPEDKHFPAPKDVLDAVKGMDKRMGLCIDTGHTTRTGADVVEWTRSALREGRVHDFDIKDLANLMDKDSQVAVGEGKMPVRELFAELLKHRYSAGVMLEYEINEDNPVPGMQKSLEHMRRVLSELKS